MHRILRFIQATLAGHVVFALKMQNVFLNEEPDTTHFKGIRQN